MRGVHLARDPLPDSLHLDSPARVKVGSEADARSLRNRALKVGLVLHPAPGVELQRSGVEACV